jgi:glycosyltransferase involved in cell wall biosynthesis
MTDLEYTAPLVSIVIPNYNHAAYLAAAIESVLNQDYPRIELIVIDDGSTDGSRDILSRYTGRCLWKTQPNCGQVATMNKGWAMSRGEILGFLASDDLLLPGAISRMVLCLNENPDAVLVYGDFNLIDPDSAIVRRVVTPEFDYAEMVTKLVCAPGPGALFRRAAFEKAGVWDERLKQMLDFEYWLRLGLVGRFQRVPTVLAAYRIHEGSQTFAASTSQIRTEEPVEILQRFFAGAKVPIAIMARKNQALAYAYLSSAQLHFRVGNFGNGLAALRHAVALWPRIVLSARAGRVVFNILFSRTAHQTLWTIRRAVRSLTRKIAKPSN